VVAPALLFLFLKWQLSNPAMNSSNAKILIVEDDFQVRETIADILEINEFRTVLAGNGEEGLAMAKHERPELILTDLAMPIMSGFDLLAALRIDPDLRTIPVIVSTARVDRAATRRAMELGAADFITKPFSEEEVLHSIAAQLEKKELLDELDAFAHTVAHDLKNPLASLMGRLELAELMFERGNEASAKNHLADASKSARRLNDIIESLLVLAGVRRQTVETLAIDMGEITAEALERLEVLLQTQSAIIHPFNNWPTAFGYAPWISEVWENFISNAAKYGGTPPEISLGGETKADGNSARFWVQDNGPGLDKEAQSLMFVPFTHKTKIRVKGNGMGLSIVRRIVEKLGGKVGVDSAPGQGARFWFELPTKKLALDQPSAPPFPDADLDRLKRTAAKD